MSKCPGCGVAKYDFHNGGCDVERCSYTGRQCDDNTHEESCKTLWSGEWPGVAQCREEGLYAKLIPYKGWVKTTADDPDGTEDLNTLFLREFDRATQSWVL